MKKLYIALFLFLIVLLISCPSEPEQIPLGNFQPYKSPVKVTDLVASRGYDDIELSWTMNKDSIVRYDIYKFDENKSEFILENSLYPTAGISKITYSSKNIDKGKVVSYYVEAVNIINLDNGNTEVKSGISNVVYGSTTPIVDFFVQTATTSAKLNWVARAVDYNGEKLVDDYYFNIYKNGKLVKENINKSENSYIDTDILPNNQYEYELEMMYKRLGGDGFVSIGKELISVKIGENYNPSEITAFNASKNTFGFDESASKLSMNYIDIGWSLTVPKSLIVDPSLSVEDATKKNIINAKPIFLIERSLVGLDEWVTVLDYKDNNDNVINTTYSSDNERYYFTYNYRDIGLNPGTEYKYRISVRYQFTSSWYTEQEKDSKVQTNTGSTLSLPADFSILSKSVTDNEDATRTVSVKLCWNIGGIELPEGLSFAIKREDTRAQDPKPELISVEPIFADGNYTVIDTFTVTEENAKVAQEYSYTLCYKYNDKEDTQSIKVSNPYFVEGTQSQFEVINADSFSVSDNLAKDILVSWTTNLTVRSDNVKYNELNLKPENIKYVIYSSEGEKIEGTANDKIFNVENNNNVLYVSYTFKDKESNASYYIEAIYDEQQNESTHIYSVTTTEAKEGRILSSITDFTASQGLYQNKINIEFNGDPKAKSFNLRYRLKGEEQWSQPISITNATGKVSYEFTSGADTISPSEKGKDIEFVVTNVDINDGESSLPSVVAGIGSYFGYYGLNPHASQTVEGAIINTDTITITWNNIANVQSYIIYKSDKKDGTYLIPESISVTGENSATDKISEDSVLTGNAWYKVVPVSKSGDQLSVNDAQAIEGTYLAPPTNINATEGEILNGIKITWDSAKNAAGYLIYRRKPNESYWDNVGIVDNVNEWIDNTVQDSNDYEYTVASKGNSSGAISMKQNKYLIEEGKNVGYAFTNIPDSVRLVYDSASKTARVEWLPVRGATKYIIEIDGKTDNISSVNDSELVSYDVPVFVSGKNILYKNITVMAINDYVENAEKRIIKTEEPNSYTFYNVEEFISEINKHIRPVLENADKKRKGDWWITNEWAWLFPSESYSENGITINLYTDSISAYYPHDKNVISIKNSRIDSLKCVISTEKDIQLDIEPYPDDDKRAGNLGKDPLKTIGYEDNGKIKITSDDGSTIYLQYKKINVYGNRSGSYALYDSSNNFLLEISDSNRISRIFN